MQAEQILEEARRLARRSCIAPSEYGTMRRAAVLLLANNRTLTYDDIRVIQFARGVWGPQVEEGPPAPPTPTPFDGEITELERRVAEAEKAHSEAVEERYALVRKWCALTRRDGYCCAGFTIAGMRPPLEPERSTTIPAGRFWSMPEPKKPPDPHEVHAADVAIQDAHREVVRLEGELRKVRGQMIDLQRSQSRWRATEPEH